LAWLFFPWVGFEAAVRRPSELNMRISDDRARYIYKGALGIVWCCFFYCLHNQFHLLAGCRLPTILADNNACRISSSKTFRMRRLLELATLSGIVALAAAQEGTTTLPLQCSPNGRGGCIPFVPAPATSSGTLTFWGPVPHTHKTSSTCDSGTLSGTPGVPTTSLTAVPTSGAETTSTSTSTAATTTANPPPPAAAAVQASRPSKYPAAAAFLSTRAVTQPPSREQRPSS
jgi:hypothetical protein